MTVKELEQQLLALPKPEKVQMLQTLIADLTDTWPGIEKTPGVVGGDACIARTRIPVWALEGYRRLGLSDAQLLENFPTLQATNLAHAWAYVAAHGEEIEQAIRENDEA
ncbi:MAG: DUF433 domain-containing protein [Caldilineaceae bacterium]